MTLPVSSYEELLARVRNLTHETIQLQRELETPLANAAVPPAPSCNSSLQLDQNLNERLLTLSLTDATCDTTCDTCDNTRGVANTWTTPTALALHVTPPTSDPHRRPNSFQRPLSTHGEDLQRSWPMNRRSTSSSSSNGSGRGERPRTAGSDSRDNEDSDDSRFTAMRLSKPSIKQKENGMEPKEEDEKRTEYFCKKEALSPHGKSEHGNASMSSSCTDPSASEQHQNVSTLYHGTWPVERSLWHSCGPNSLGGSKSLNQDASSVMSFSSSVGSPSLPSARRTYSQQQLTSKVDMVYSLLSMLGTQENRDDMTKTFLAMSSSPDSCQTMRQSGCLPLLVQFIHVPDRDAETRRRASQALHNLVHSQSDDKRGRREARVLRLLEQVRDYCDALREALLATTSAGDEEVTRPAMLDDMERHPGPTIAALMKLSFDEEHRHAMCTLGGLQAIAELIQLDHDAHGSTTSDQYCVTLRRYAGMALTNLTFGDGTNKTMLCSLRDFMKALVAQLNSPSEELRQVTASVLRNLSWRADTGSKQTLREVGAVTGLMWAAIDGKKESTLKSILSALWNLSAHCSLNKVDICAVDGALGFLIGMLNYKAPSKTLAIVENAGGILRNISSHIAIREDYRAILRQHNCLHVLLQQLKSPSLTIVSNACGSLWNLSARCPEDQKALWDMGAVNMLRSLVHSKHKMISMGSSAALKNLLGAKPNNNYPLEASKIFGLSAVPSLVVRKQKALEQELDQNLSETCDNIEPSTSPSRDDKFIYERTEERHRQLRSQYQAVKQARSHVSRSDSRDSVTSTLSDTVYERVSRSAEVLGHSPGEKASSVHGALTEDHAADSLVSDKKFLRRYMNTMKEQSQRRSALSLEVSTEDSGLEKEVPEPADELGSPYSRLGHSDDVYLEKNRDSKRVRERVQESLTASVNSEVKPFSAKPPSRSSLTYSRNKFSDLEIDPGIKEEPVDYSLKYVEPIVMVKTEEVKEEVEASESVEEFPMSNQKDMGRTYTTETPPSKNIKMNVAYGDYAETDLDQPTDYSLKYAEEDEYLEFDKSAEVEQQVGEPEFYPSTSPVHEDTLKTYYTEGTPYETPYNFSTATSMSDLHIDPAAPEEKKPDKVEAKPEAEKPEKPVKEPAPSTPKLPLELGSGMMSPEKPVQYYEEGTPGSFSCISSLSSLSSVPVNPAAAVVKPGAIKDEEPREAKVVTFNSTDHYAEETPLMFSRCSSLGSLSSFDQHSIHDGSSVISDFSRRTSGIVSPSELPDSPTQTVPPSPRRLKDFTGHLGAVVAPKPSVFEDDVAAFKEEDTPVEFSRATSLSSLTIDDEPRISREAPRLGKCGVPAGIHQRRAERDREEGMEKQDVEKEKRELADCCELAPVSEGEEDDEDMLAACINIGMQNSARHKYKAPQTRFGAARGAKPADTGTKSTAVDLPGACEDALLEYCTEGTPANVSNAGSHSDLSILSFACDREEATALKAPRIEPELSDSSSNFSGDNDNILAECIQSGMPKARAPQIAPQTPEVVVVAAPRKPQPAARRMVPQCPLRIPAIGFAADEMETYNTEGSPRTFSTRSSLSDLTVSTEGAAGVASCLKRSVRSRPLSEGTSCDTPLRFSTEDTPLEVSHAASLSSLSCAEEERFDQNPTDPWDPSPGLKPFNKTSSVSEDVVTVLSRNGSLSSLSVDSFGSTEPSEQALLEQCINSGMPKSRATRRVVNHNQGNSSLELAASYDLDQRMAGLTLGSKNEQASPAADAGLRPIAGEEKTRVDESPEENGCMRQSTERNTWDDDLSPNDVSFPSISSAPMLPSCLVSTSVSMSDSRRIQVEAEKLTVVFRIEGESYEDRSLDLDAVRMPSMIDSFVSLTASVSEMGDADVRNNSAALLLQKSRQLKKKALPAGVMVRRALGTSHNGTDVFDSISLGSVASQIDNVKMPSAMEDLVDMENSMISVASITSEVADVMRDQTDLPGCLNGDVSELDNVYPPSALNDVTDLTMEPGSETMCSDTEIAEDPDDIDAPELPNDCKRPTPVGSEAGSIESTPKKRQKPRLLTPKQKRQLVKERYQTYTISAEEERQLEMVRMSKETEKEEDGGKKVTPKQRRLEDRSRFETRVLNRTYTIETEAKSGIPKPDSTRRNIKTLKEKRAAAKERYRTRTLSDSLDPTQEQIEMLLQRDADLVISTLNETQQRGESDEAMLECETLSLISIESESDQSKKRTATRESSLEEVEDPEEKTYRADSLTPMEEVTMCEALDSEPEEEKKEAVGPRITKPTSLRLESSEETVVNAEAEAKSVRGRRKALYSTPASRRGQTVAVSNATKGRNVPAPAASGPVRPTRASALRQGRGSTTSRPSYRATPSAVETKIKVTRAVKPEAEEKSRFRPPERQGTFTKEESTCAAPSSPTKTRIPVAGSPARLKVEPKKEPSFKVPMAAPPKVKPTKTPASRLAKTLSLEANVTRGNKVAPKSAAIPLRHSGVPSLRSDRTLRTSVSNQSLQSQRSASNSSLNSISSAGKTRVKPPKKEVTSKIASLWKRVEEIQVQQRFPKKDTRVWITGEEKAGEEKPEGFRQKLVRSSTFDGLAPKVVEVEGKSRLTEAVKQVSDMGTYKAGGADVVPRRRSTKTEDPDQRLSRLGSFFSIEEATPVQPPARGPASAIVPPYNYSPPPRPSAVSLIPAPVKPFKMNTSSDISAEVGTASKKVTTV